MEQVSTNSFYLSVSTFVLGRGCLSKYMEYQDISCVVKDVIGRQKLHYAEYSNQVIQNSYSVGKQYYPVERNYRGQYIGVPLIKSVEEIIAVICLNNNRILRSNGKVWDQLSSLDAVWLVTDREWEHYSNEVLLRHSGHSGQMLRQRHGRRLIYRHPSALTLQKLQEFVEYFFLPNNDYNFVPPIPITNKEQPKKGPIVNGNTRISVSRKNGFELMNSDYNQAQDSSAVETSKKNLFPSNKKPLGGMSEEKDDVYLAADDQGVQKRLYSYNSDQFDLNSNQQEQQGNEDSSSAHSRSEHILFDNYFSESPVVDIQVNEGKSASRNEEQRELRIDDKSKPVDGMEEQKMPAGSIFHDPDFTAEPTNEAEIVKRDSSNVQDTSISLDHDCTLYLNESVVMEKSQIELQHAPSVGAFATAENDSIISFYSCADDVPLTEGEPEAGPGAQSVGERANDIIDIDAIEVINSDSPITLETYDTVSKHSTPDEDPSTPDKEQLLHEIPKSQAEISVDNSNRPLASKSGSPGTKAASAVANSPVEEISDESSLLGDMSRQSSGDSGAGLYNSSHPIAEEAVTENSLAQNVDIQAPNTDIEFAASPSRLALQHYKMNREKEHPGSPYRHLFAKKSVQSHGQDDISSKYRLQAAELEEVTRARAALEIRLQETRQMLESFAAGNNPKAVLKATAEIDVSPDDDKEKPASSFSSSSTVPVVRFQDQEDRKLKNRGALKLESTRSSDFSDVLKDSSADENDESGEEESAPARQLSKKDRLKDKLKFRKTLRKSLATSLKRKPVNLTAKATLESATSPNSAKETSPIIDGRPRYPTRSSPIPSRPTEEPPSATKLLTSSSKFFSKEAAPSDILEIDDRGLVLTIQDPPKASRPSPKLRHPVAVNSPDKDATSKIIPAVSNLTNEANLRNGETKTETVSVKQLTPDSNRKGKTSSQYRKVSNNAPRVITLELPDLEEEELPPTLNIVKEQPDPVKAALPLGQTKEGDPVFEPRVVESDSVIRRSLSGENILQSVGAPSRSRSGSIGSSVQKRNNSLSQVPADISHQYLSQLRYVLEEIDDVISSAPSARKETLVTETSLAIELDAVAEAAAAAAAAVNVANRKIPPNSSIYKRVIGESLQRKEDRLRRRQYVFDGNERDLSFARETDEEASFPSINSRDKIVNLGKRASYISNTRAYKLRDDQSEIEPKPIINGESLLPEKPATNIQRKFQPSADYYYSGDNVSVTSAITMESSVPASPSPMKEEISIPMSSSHLPVYSYIEQDFEYFYRAEQQYRLREQGDGISEGVDSKRFSMPPSGLESDFVQNTASTAVLDSKQSGIDPVYSRSLSYSSSHEDSGGRRMRRELLEIGKAFERSVPSPSKAAVAPTVSSSLSNQSSAEKKDPLVDSSGNESSFISFAPEINILNSQMKVVNSYFSPFLITSKVLDASIGKDGSSGLDPLEATLWCVFQLYGIADGIVVKQIKTSQISRALKDAGICSLNSSQLDLMLVKVYARLSANNKEAPSYLQSVSGAVKRSGLNMNLTSKSITGKNGNGIPSNGTGPSSGPLATASFEAFKDLFQKLVEHLAASKSQKKVAKGLPSSDNPQDAQLELMDSKLKNLILSRSFDSCEIHLLESKVSISGLLLGTIYQKPSSLPVPAKDSSSKQRKQYLQHLISKSILFTYSPADIEMVRTVWERNAEPAKQIFLCYATSTDSRTAQKLMLGFEECREMMTDFHIVPQLLDSQCFARIFRTCKLFEWRLADIVTAGTELATEASFSGSKPNQALQEEHFDFRTSVGNFSLTLCGFLELLTRIACNNNKLGPSPPQSLENLLHLMDISGGKTKLSLKATRKSLVVKSFVYINNKH